MPRILRGVGGRGLSCGCLVGVYETYTNETVAIIDAKGPACTEETHRVDSNVTVEASDLRAQPPSTSPTMMR